MFEMFRFCKVAALQAMVFPNLEMVYNYYFMLKNLTEVTKMFLSFIIMFHFLWNKLSLGNMIEYFIQINHIITYNDKTFKEYTVLLLK